MDRRDRIPMNNEASDPEALWGSAQRGTRAFDLADFTHVPASAQRYLAHAISPGTPLANAVRLRMHGAIRLGRWWPFKAEQVIVRGRGMIWRASVKMHGMPIRGSDRLVDGVGAMQWKLWGVLPIVRASGPDITRSAAGRAAAESVWLPSLFCGDGIAWSGADDPAVARAVVLLAGAATTLDLALDDGHLRSVSLSRWGNPDGGPFREVAFGAIVDQEASFGGYTIPARLRVGWHFGTNRFDGEGKFFQVTVDEAVYR
jgi:hypothetical protein